MSRLLALLLGLALSWPAISAPAAVPALAPDILLANVYRDGLDPGQYLVSEKLDGVRAVWDGTTLRFRSGRPIQAPAWFIAGLPRQPLDGELWIGRGSFERLSGVVRREQPDDAEWRQVRYMIFELPGAAGAFGERADAMRQLAAQAGVPWLAAVEQERVADRRLLQARFDRVLAAGGEGLMLHRIEAPYETGRSDTLLKLKPWQDAEAVVVGHRPGKGKYAGQLGALRLRTADGREFSVGSGFSDRQRREPPPLGAVVTYRFRELTAGGQPRFPSFVRLQHD